ncbi:universal stress protein [Streptomyces celluloflavus]|uniref:universal stress protein n=1 Tax=Streptomyces celluloflavus TaxID=58344 RepID=UPI0036B20ADA
MPDPHEGTDRVVVGVDGSASSKEALRWAIRQAELTHSAVDAVLAWHYPAFYGSFGWPPSGGEFDARATGGQVLAEAVNEVAGRQPPVAIRTIVAHGTAPDVLLHAARQAGLLVVGSRGHGGFTEALLGSVAQHCTQHAPCPIVVVRGQGH